MADKSIKITIKTALDSAGIQATEDQINRMASRMRLTSQQMRRDSDNAVSSDGVVKELSKIKTNLMRLAGVAALFWASFKVGFKIGEGIRKFFVDNFSAAEREIRKSNEACRKFNEELKKLSDADVQKVSDEYASLSAEINKVSNARLRENKILEDCIRLSRERMKAERELAKQKEIAGSNPLDANAREEIENRYARLGSEDDAMKMKLDAVLERQKLEQEAKDALSAAEKIDAMIRKAEASASRLRVRAGTLSALSTSRNEGDGAWYSLTKRTEAGDKIREEQAKGSEEAKKRVAKIEQSIEKMKAESDKLRLDAKSAEERRNQLWKEIETADMMMESIAEKSANEIAEKEAKEWEKTIKKRQQDWDDAQSFINATMEDAAREEEKRQKKLADAEKKAVKEAHDAKIKALDEEEKKTQKMIDRLLARGADNPLARAGGGNWQANDEREARQKKINDDRMKAEQDKLEKRARAKFGDDWLKELEKPENRKKLGRLNNLQAAALEKMQLDANKNKVADIEKQRQKAIDDMNKTLDDISKKLDSVGL